MKIIYLLAITIMMASCSSIKKTTSSESSSLDITAVAKSDSSRLFKKDSTGEKKSADASLIKKDSTGVTQVDELEQEKITVNLLPADPGKKVANDYDGAPEVFDVTINGQQIKSSQPIGSIVVENSKGKKTLQASDVKTVDSSSNSASERSQVAIFDSSAQHRADSLAIAAEQKKQASEKKRSGFSVAAKIGMIAGLILLIILGIKFGWFSGIIRWFLGLFRRKNKDPSLPYSSPPPPLTKK